MSSKDRVGPSPFTNIEKQLFPEGYRKIDVLAYYQTVAPTILPYLIDRPQNLHKSPNGVLGDSFWEKDANHMRLPSFVETVAIPSLSARREKKYVLCQNVNTLLYLVNAGCIDFNPWNSKVGNIDRPDYALLDLDPREIPFEACTETALKAKNLLDTMNIPSFCKTSGGKGLHVYIPLGATYSFDEIKAFTQFLALVLHKELPDITSLERMPEKRKGKVYIDYLQNRYGQATVAAYSVRPKERALVSTPLAWGEVTENLHPEAFTMDTVPQRIQKFGDLWKGVLGKGIDIQQSLLKLRKTYSPRPLC